MLTTLRIRNLALVENISIEFRPGLNMITGETGAGKSILMGALALLLGERADRGMIRSGEEACGAEAVFLLKDPEQADAALDEFGLAPCEEGRLVVRRLVRANGSGHILVNDSPVTLQALRRLGELLVDMHGPHDHQSLLRPEAQLDILDAYGHLWVTRAAYEATYSALRQLEARRAELTSDQGDFEEVLDLLRHRVKEIREAGPKEGEEQKILEEHQVVGNAQRVLELAGGVVNALTEGESSAFAAMAGSTRPLEELGRLMPPAVEWRAELQELTRRLQELSTSMQRLVGEIDADPARLDWLDQRLAVYQRLKKKYGPELPDILHALETAEARLKDMENREEQLAALDKEADALRQRLDAEGRALHGSRAAVSDKLGAAVTNELRALGFTHGEFTVHVQSIEAAASGMDHVEFGFAPNAGEPMRPLRAIASSGEISRVMLATKTVLADHDRVPVLVFDEIDANLGGEMGHAVGAKLAQVAHNHQVICITHLPQVAVFGRTHFAVAKEVRDNRTITDVRMLADKEDRAREVARMLGGEQRSTVTLQHAREMLGRAG